jgi:hypothetical protein
MTVNKHREARAVEQTGTPESSLRAPVSTVYIGLGLSGGSGQMSRDRMSAMMTMAKTHMRGPCSTRRSAVGERLS